jgi:hypothetical protein
MQYDNQRLRKPRKPSDGKDASLDLEDMRASVSEADAMADEIDQLLKKSKQQEQQQTKGCGC